jgi:caspase domain-containing protein
MSDLPDPIRSRALLIGTSTYSCPDLPDIPAVRNNIADLYDVLTSPVLTGLYPDSCRRLREPPGNPQVYGALRKAAEEAQDTLLIYFAGHGKPGKYNELYLCLAETDPDMLPVTAFRYEDLQEAVAGTRATKKVVILDCCFSGRALSRPDLAGDEDTILGNLDVAGTYILTAAPRNRVAMAPEGERHTAFTGTLLNILRTGIPRGPQFLTFPLIFPHLKSSLIARQLPRPSQVGSDTIEHLAISHNPAYTSPGPDRGAGPGPSRGSPAEVVRERLPYLRSLRNFMVIGYTDTRRMEELAGRHYLEVGEELLAIWRLGGSLLFKSTEGIAFTTRKISVSTDSETFEIPYSRFREFLFKRGSQLVMTTGTSPSVWLEIDGDGSHWRSSPFTTSGRVTECDYIVQLLKDIRRAVR